MTAELDGYTSQVLTALVEGYRAREGMKPRARCLSEYELARRLGVTQYSYAQFEASAERAQLLQALGELLRQRLIVRAGASGRYDTFVPADEPQPTPPALAAGPPFDADAPLPERTVALLEQVTRQLGEALEVLRSIDRKLGPD